MILKNPLLQQIICLLYFTLHFIFIASDEHTYYLKSHLYSDLNKSQNSERIDIRSEEMIDRTGT